MGQREAGQISKEQRIEGLREEVFGLRDRIVTRAFEAQWHVLTADPQAMRQWIESSQGKLTLTLLRPIEIARLSFEEGEARERFPDIIEVREKKSTSNSFYYKLVVGDIDDQTPDGTIVETVRLYPNASLTSDLDLFPDTATTLFSALGVVAFYTKPEYQELYNEVRGSMLLRQLQDCEEDTFYDTKNRKVTDRIKMSAKIQQFSEEKFQIYEKMIAFVEAHEEELLKGLRDMLQAYVDPPLTQP